MIFLNILPVLLTVFLCTDVKHVAALNTRIVGGSEIAIEKCSYQLSLLQNGQHKCGAVVINKSWALTSAGCVNGVQVKDITLRAGSNTHKSGGTIHTTKRIILHSSFNGSTKDYDVALIETSNAFDTKTIKPIALVTEGSIVKPGSQALVTGWGVLTLGSTLYSDKLQQVTVPVVEKTTCQLANGNISDRMLCAGLTSGGKDICNGDFGGPMVYQDKLIGIASWSKTCGKPGSFGVYTSISQIRDWIKKTSGV